MAKIKVKNLNLYYGNFQALINIDAEIKENQITAIIGPSGCGKTTLIRVFDRMNDLIEGVKISGEVLIDEKNIYSPETDLIKLRRSVGMVFQRPNPFPLSIFENVAYGLRVHGEGKRNILEEAVEGALEDVFLFDKLKDRIGRSALSLTLEEQQRLCIARLIALKPDILLMDEPCSALDPYATLKIEELMIKLKKNYTIVIVTHNMQQAARISDEVGFMLLGELIEFGKTTEIFTTPKDKRTEDYITGRFG